MQRNVSQNKILKRRPLVVRPTTVLYYVSGLYPKVLPTAVITALCIYFLGYQKFKQVMNRQIGRTRL